MMVTQQQHQLLVIQQQGQNTPEIQAQTMQLMERAQLLSQQQQSRRGTMWVGHHVWVEYHVGAASCVGGAPCG